jgi:hypothetical protein
MARRRQKVLIDTGKALLTGHFPVPARKLITVNETEWDEPIPVGDDRWLTPGAIVRLKPPGRVTREEIQETREKMLRAGAAAVRVISRTREEVVVRAEEVPESVSVRTVVEEMAEEANTHNREALKVALQRAMGKAGI